MQYVTLIAGSPPDARRSPSASSAATTECEGKTPAQGPATRWNIHNNLDVMTCWRDNVIYTPADTNLWKRTLVYMVLDKS